MEISKEDIEERFRTLSDEVLLERLRTGTLTPMAMEVALAELRSRGIEPATHSDADTLDESEEHLDVDDDVDLVTVARFTNAIDPAPSAA